MHLKLQIGKGMHHISLHIAATTQQSKSKKEKTGRRGKKKEGGRRVGRNRGKGEGVMPGEKNVKRNTSILSYSELLIKPYQTI